MSISKFHEAALELARQGIPVFPCAPNSKRPACENGVYDATTNEDQINEWWTENPNFNLAIAPEPAGLCVVDVDGDEGEASWFQLQLDNGFIEDTREVFTPRAGGHHYYFKGSLAPTVSKIAKKVDTRGIGSYVLVPPSVTPDGSYVYANDNPYSDVPEWVVGAVNRPKEHHKAAIEDLDLAPNIARARSRLKALVAAQDVAIEGYGGDNRTYQLCAETLNFGLSPAKALELIEEIWNPACQPPWDHDDLAQKVLNANDYAQNEPGAWAVAPAEQTFDPNILDRLVAESASQEPTGRPRFYLLDEDEQDALKEPTWIIPEILADQSTMLLYGPGDSFKTFLALDMALGIASGTETFGFVPKKKATVYIAGEGASNIGKKRRAAWRIGRGIDEKIPFYIIGTPPTAADPSQIVEMISQIKKQLKGQECGLVVIDTLATFSVGLDENNQKDAGMIVAAANFIRQELNCSVILIHHSGKDEKRGARGSSAIMYGVDAAAEAIATHDTMAVAIWVRRQKDGERRKKPFTFEGRVIGPSLVFFPTDEETYKMQAGEDDPIAPSKIGKALRELEAVGKDKGVTTSVLATHLLPPDPNEDGEAHQRRVQSLTKMLGKSASKKLTAYCEGTGRDLAWFMPEG